MRITGTKIERESRAKDPAIVRESQKVFLWIRALGATAGAVLLLLYMMT